MISFHCQFHTIVGLREDIIKIHLLGVGHVVNWTRQDMGCYPIGYTKDLGGGGRQLSPVETVFWVQDFLGVWISLHDFLAC